MTVNTPRSSSLRHASDERVELLLAGVVVGAHVVVVMTVERVFVLGLAAGAFGRRFRVLARLLAIGGLLFVAGLGALLPVLAQRRAIRPAAGDRQRGQEPAQSFQRPHPRVLHVRAIP